MKYGNSLSLTNIPIACSGPNFVTFLSFLQPAPAAAADMYICLFLMPCKGERPAVTAYFSCDQLLLLALQDRSRPTRQTRIICKEHVISRL